MYQVFFSIVSHVVSMVPNNSTPAATDTTFPSPTHPRPSPSQPTAGSPYDPPSPSPPRPPLITYIRTSAPTNGALPPARVKDQNHLMEQEGAPRACTNAPCSRPYHTTPAYRLIRSHVSMSLSGRDRSSLTRGVVAARGMRASGIGEGALDGGICRPFLPLTKGECTLRRPKQDRHRSGSSPLPPRRVGRARTSPRHATAYSTRS
ncbi:hypothetical protein FPV67DRAFT_649653 [Lyophyllum atratum]|nr:hypothetical protein FPV67DRAFT_649653 [Lyophyllum atratum]